jgi:preprotein translocase subunit SecB
MEAANQIQLKFHGVDFPIINLHSEKPKLKDDDTPIAIDITPKVFYPKDHPYFFNIIHEIRLSSEKHFDLFLIAVGSFEMNENTDEQIKKTFVNTNAPAIMFPYVRSFISTLTANLGNVTGTLTIPTQFFKGELEVIAELPNK